jgi:hypothetical protein
MTRPPWEVADVIQRGGSRFLDRYRKSLTWQQVKVFNAITRCRTAALGGHRDQCDRCGRQAISYNSCRNRHCPKCQTNARDKWLRSRQQELLPVHLLSRRLQRASPTGPLHVAEQASVVHSSIRSHCRDAARSGRELEAPRCSDWLLECSAHRVAISNHRLLNVTDHDVTFRWKDYAHHSKSCSMTLTHEEFLRRFFQHVPPGGFPRIRYFGFLANRRRRLLLPLCRNLLGASPAAVATSASVTSVHACPRCQAPMRIIERLTAFQLQCQGYRLVVALDTS